MAIDRSDQQNRIAINRTEKLLIEPKSYQQKKMAIDRIERPSIDQNDYR